MSSTSVAIELLSDHIDLAMLKGSRVVDSRRLPLDLPSDATSWAKGVRTCGERLKEVVGELDLAGARTRVLYRSPTQAVDLASFDLRSATQSCEAAALTAGQNLPYATTSSVVQSLSVGRDRSGEQRRWHIVVAADRVDVVRAIVEMVELAGLTFDSATPLDAAIMAGLVERVLRYAGPQHGWLYFGQHASFFILGGEGRLSFERSIGLGTETVVQSLTRPIRVPDEQPIELTYATAKKIVHEHGIPDSDDVLDEEINLTRRHIMPQIQPVLQRYVVELRQSLRFGLSDDERSSIEVSVLGPGSRIPGLTELVAWELKLDFKPDSQYAAYDYASPASAGSELVDALENRSVLEGLNMQPPELARQRQLGRLKRWMWIGAVITLAVVALDGFRLQRAVADAKQDVASWKGRTKDFEKVEKNHNQLVAAITAMNNLEEIIVREVGASVNMRAVFQELSLLTPESVRINSMRFAREDQRMTGRLYGRAAPVDAATNQTELESYIESIKESPLFENAVLRNVEVGGIDGAGGQRFEASFEVLLAPGVESLPAMAEGRP